MAAKTASLSVNIIADAAKARAGLKEAETAFGKFRREVNESQGAMGKFQTISGSAFDFVKRNAVNFAAAAGSAIAVFVGQSVSAFQDLALGAGKFADATGLAVEDASRFIEVAGDIGIEAGTVEKALGFLNKTLGNSPQLFEALGVEVARTADGSTNVAETFLNVVSRLNEIKDPAERASTATRLLGRGWMEMAELIGMGSDQLAQSLAAVSDAKVISPEERQRAIEYRAATDNLKDSWEDFSLTIGEAVVPALTDVLIKFTEIVNHPVGKKAFGEALFAGGLKNIGTLDKGLEDLIRRLTGTDEATVNFDGTVFNLGVGLGNTKRATDNLDTSSYELGLELERQAKRVDMAKDAWDRFRGGLSFKLEFSRLEQDIASFEKEWANATDQAKADSQEYRDGVLGNQLAVANLFLTVQGLATWSQQNRIQLLIETNRLEYALTLIRMIKEQSQNIGGPMAFPGPENIPVPPQYQPPKQPIPPKAPAKAPAKVAPKPAATFGGPKIQTKRIPGLAAGGTLLSSGGVIVGEFGPELLNLPRGASVTPNIPRRMDGGGQTIINIQVQAGLVSSPDQVGQQIIDAIRRAERRSGQVFASV